MSEQSETVTLTIDGQEVTVPKGTNVIEAAQKLGEEISAFCYHPGLSVVAVCRQCLVTIEGSPKPVPSCQAIATDGMVVHTKDDKSTGARKQMLEFTLVNHPIDCPICDKAGECTLQKHYVDHDNAESRVDVPKVRKPKVVNLGPDIVLDAERCILCTRCIRVCDEVAGSHQLDMAHRGNHEELGTAPGEQLDNDYSINTVDVCPVGALTSKDFRFTMRAWELYSTPSVCNGCATGCNIDIHHKDSRAWRLIPRDNLDVNKYWMCDEGRFTYHQLRDQRLVGPVVDGMPSSWEKASAKAAGLIDTALKSDPTRVAVVFSPQLTNEDNFALKILTDKWGVKNTFIGGKPAVPGRADKILKDADVNPNTKGARLIAGDSAKDASALEQALRSHSFSAVIVLGQDVVLSDEAEYALTKLDALVVLANHETGLAKRAHVALPVASWAEVDGTVTNRDGLTQRMHAAFEPPGQALPGWRAVDKLASATAAGALGFESVQSTHEKMVSAVSGFESGPWKRHRRPVQLRFANSRG